MKQNLLFLWYLFIGLFFLSIIFSCHNDSKVTIKPTIDSTNDSTKINEETNLKTNFKQDSIEIVKLTKEMYKWELTQDTIFDFDPILNNQTDTYYYRLDINKHNRKMKELKNSGFFSQSFLNNYDKIAQNIDKKLLNKSMIYEVGYMPPYGPDANVWCLCQDYPDEYWNLISINNLKIDNIVATYTWIWKDDSGDWNDQSNYKVKALKENGNWKIAYLEGFDFKNFINQKN